MLVCALFERRRQYFLQKYALDLATEFLLACFDKHPNEVSLTPVIKCGLPSCRTSYPIMLDFSTCRERPFLLNIKQRWLQNFLPMVQTKLFLLRMERTFSVKSRPIASSSGAHIVSTNADIL